MLNTPEIVLEHYRISHKTGFLPDTPPLQTIQDPYYEPWESIARDLPSHTKTGRLRPMVDNLPVLSLSRLSNEAERRRAYVVLAYITHAYVWGGEKPMDVRLLQTLLFRLAYHSLLTLVKVLPPSISRPFLEISFRLDLPACATYAAVCLWNFSLKEEEEGRGRGRGRQQPDFTNPDVLSVTTSFTGTKDEEWFFMVSAAIEAKGAHLIPLMLNAIHASNLNDTETVTTSLDHISDGIRGISKTLQRMHEKCGPAVFFHDIRPFLAGGKNMAVAGLPAGIFYDLGDGCGEWREYSGGSNAQSSLIQTFDIFLGVEHTATEEAMPSSSSSPPFSCAVQEPVKTGYLQEMRNYMPGPHRRFLETLSRISNVRTYAMHHGPESPLRKAYNSTVLDLAAFRGHHIQLVSRYIIMASKRTTTTTATRSSINDPDPDPQQKAGRMNIATATSKGVEIEQQSAEKEKSMITLVGTGGTDLIPFLRHTRDTTKATVW